MPDLREYQEVAVDFIRKRNRAGLMMDMGTGKTACVLAALEPRHLPALVVAPKRVAEETWDVEAEKFRPDLSISLAVGGPEDRRRALNSRADIHVIGRDNFRDVTDTHLKPKTLVIDELSGYKNHESTRFKTAKALINEHSIANVWGLTGTPAPNGYIDLWSQVYLLDGGKRLGKNITGYRSRYFKPGLIKNNHVVQWEIRKESAANIKRLIEDICLAMSSEGRVDLPSVIFNDIPTNLPPRVRKAYSDLESTMVTDLTDIFGGDVHSAGDAAHLTSRLSQILAGFIYVDDADLHNMAYTPLHDEKMEGLARVLDEPHEGGVLCAYRFRPEVDMIKERFPFARTIDEPGVVKAWNRGEVPLLVAHPASAGHGLNLQYGGHTVVWLEPTWDLELWDQFNKRLNRPGQPHPVVIHVLACKDSIDPKIRKRLETKAGVQLDLLEFLESPV